MKNYTVIKRSFGRRKGRPLRKKRTLLMEQLLPFINVSLPIKGLIDLNKLFNFQEKKEEVWLEIGFGGGEHLAFQAASHQKVGMIGCEIYLNGIASLLAHVDDQEINNIRIYPNDVRYLLPRLKEACLDKVFILFPDPWPKARHHKRRLISQVFLKNLTRVLKNGAEIRFASDDSGYIDWILECIGSNEEIQLPQGSIIDWQQHPCDYPETRYGMKAKDQGLICTHLLCKRYSRD
jgi:tRNA (guanine-N7-)-methyltransferase